MFQSFFKRLRALFQSSPKRVPFKPEWESYLVENLPIYSKLPDQHKASLRNQVSEFIPRVYWEGVNGLELTEEMIVSVASQACLLTLNMRGNPYARLKTVILFPKVFNHEGTSVDAGGTYTESRHRVAGLSYERGTVSLAWSQTEYGARFMNDGVNVVFHEFAHQLDQADGYANGAPILRRPEHYKEWCSVMEKAYAKLVDASERGKVSLLDHYGATNPAEFFAVATETFFEKPRKMYKRFPDLYEIMEQYYQLDPKAW